MLEDQSLPPRLCVLFLVFNGTADRQKEGHTFVSAVKIYRSIPTVLFCSILGLIVPLAEYCICMLQLLYTSILCCDSSLVFKAEFVPCGYVQR